MVENTDRCWYIAIDIIMFVLAVITFLLLLTPAGESLSSAVDTYNAGNTRISISGELTGGTQEVYMGRKTYDSRHLYGDNIETIDYGEYASHEGVYQELLAMPENVTEIRIDGRIYANDADEDRTVNGSDNLAYYLASGETDKVYDWIGTGNLFLKKYETDDMGRIYRITYTSQ
ncbi:MAG: hypothetical protein LUE86_01355 [Clostridiales bacterium]|nr:hypothetical protein [Clostridiales bacterium]